MEIILYISLYLLPGVIGYFLMRKAMLVEFDDWTVQDRNVSLLCVLTSFIFLFISLFYYVQAMSDDNKKSKW